MQINIPNDAEELVRSQAAASGFQDVDQYVMSLILREMEDAAFDERLTDEEMAGSLAIIDRSMDEVRLGRTMSVSEARRRTLEELGLTER